MGTRKDLRERFRVRMGFPEDTTTGNDRFNATLNSALRHLWSDLPDVLLTEEFRFVTEPPVEGGTLHLYNDTDGATVPTGMDSLVFVMLAPPSVEALAKPEIVRGRWLEIYDGTNYHLRRIRDLFTANYQYATGSGTATISNAFHIVVDRMFAIDSDGGIGIAAGTTYSYRIITVEYPYPADVQKITHLMYNPEGGGAGRVMPMLRGDHNRWRRSVGWRSTGTPQAWARGDFYQEPAPRYTPAVELHRGTTLDVDQAAAIDAANEGIWGYDTSAVQHGYMSSNSVQPKYGPAGTFSYKVVHVWGRRPKDSLMNEGDYAPWYISAASDATEKISTKWGESSIVIKSPNIDVSHGYGPNTTKPSYRRYGVEKWIFRARHENEPDTGGLGALIKEYPEDGVYYLWAIVDGEVTEVRDYGQNDPPDRRMSIEAWHGHQSIRFDRLPTTVDSVVMQVVKRPPQLHHDHDAPRIPEECMDCLFALCASYLAGDRDGSMEKKQFYLAEYAEHRRRLIRLMGIETAMMPAFGDGLGMADQGIWESAGQTVKEA